MTDKLPPNLLALFAPRPPLRWVQPVDVAPAQRKTAKITGLAEFLPALAAYKETDNYVPTESWLQARDRKKREKVEKHETDIKEGSMKHNPSDDPNIRGDAFKTLIVARLSYDANEHDLEREFGRFGPIERIRIVTDTHADEKPNKKKKPHRGYAFVVFEREKDMRAALDGCDGIRIKDRRIKVDVERGRTVKGWKPRRFGGGLGGRGYTKAAAARPTGPGGFGGGFGGGRDGFRGGFGGRGRGGGFRGGDRGFRGGGGGMGRDRGFGAPNGFAPPNAPSGPGAGGRSGGYGDRDRERDRHGGGGGSAGGYESRGGGGRSYDDRSGGGGFRDGGRFGDRDRQRSGANNEPVRERGDRGGRDYRDQDRSRDDDNRKRGYEGGGYEDPRKLRRY